jgi:phosphoserine phosphatase
VTVSFVDVDGTLTCANMSFLFGRHMYSIGKISLLKALSCTFLYVCHLAGILSVSRLHHAIFKLVFLGKNRTEVLAWAEQFFAQNSSTLLRPSMIDEMRELKRRNVSTVLLSSSPDFLVSFVARAFGGLEYRATEYLWDKSGFFSQVGVVMSGTQKGYIASEYRKKGWNKIAAFTDSLQDKPLLELSDEVVAVCPGYSLRKMARKRGWRIIPK